ncbi:hypothetical protein V6N13_064538 [Hibiscus sabdariffa]|uniref:NAC domain-containing protein n=1 Tax=Hibiscus sabdariffa TaxID=183260 RepID=A0ABR2EBV9_9ROSI
MARIPPGFRFVPTDYELIRYYLWNKSKGQPLPCDKDIHEYEIYGEKNKEPWNIFGETWSKTFYVFTKLRKKGKGRRIDRIAGSGTWKGQRTDPVMDSEKNHVGDRKLFVFEVKGRSNNDGKGHWIMHEFSLINDDQLDNWVLCRIYNKNNKNRPLELDEDDSEDDMLRTVPPSASIESQDNAEFQLSSSFGALLDTQGDGVYDARMENDGINNGLISNQLSTQGSSFGALLDTQGDGMFDAVMGSDGINNGLISNQLSTEGSSFEALLDGQEDSVFDAVLGSDGFISNQLGYSDLSMLKPLKRSLSSLYCIEFEDETPWPCTSKRFRGNSNDGGDLENATPPSPPLQQQQAMLESTGDGILGSPFQLPGPNCYYYSIP